MLHLTIATLFRTSEEQIIHLRSLILFFPPKFHEVLRANTLDRYVRLTQPLLFLLIRKEPRVNS